MVAEILLFYDAGSRVLAHRAHVQSVRLLHANHQTSTLVT